MEKKPLDQKVTPGGLFGFLALASGLIGVAVAVILIAHDIASVPYHLWFEQFPRKGFLQATIVLAVAMLPGFVLGIIGLFQKGGQGKAMGTISILLAFVNSQAALICLIVWLAIGSIEKQRESMSGIFASITEELGYASIDDVEPFFDTADVPTPETISLPAREWHELMMVKEYERVHGTQALTRHKTWIEIAARMLAEPPTPWPHSIPPPTLEPGEADSIKDPLVLFSLAILSQDNTQKLAWALRAQQADFEAADYPPAIAFLNSLLILQLKPDDEKTNRDALNQLSEALRRGNYNSRDDDILATHLFSSSTIHFFHRNPTAISSLISQSNSASPTLKEIVSARAMLPEHAALAPSQTKTDAIQKLEEAISAGTSTSWPHLFLIEIEDGCGKQGCTEIRKRFDDAVYQYPWELPLYLAYINRIKSEPEALLNFALQCLATDANSEEPTILSHIFLESLATFRDTHGINHPVLRDFQKKYELWDHSIWATESFIEAQADPESLQYFESLSALFYFLNGDWEDALARSSGLPEGLHPLAYQQWTPIALDMLTTMHARTGFASQPFLKAEQARAEGNHTLAFESYEAALREIADPLTRSAIEYRVRLCQSLNSLSNASISSLPLLCIPNSLDGSPPAPERIFPQPDISIDCSELSPPVFTSDLTLPPDFEWTGRISLDTPQPGNLIFDLILHATSDSQPIENRVRFSVKGNQTEIFLFSPLMQTDGKATTPVELPTETLKDCSFTLRSWNGLLSLDLNGKNALPIQKMPMDEMRNAKNTLLSIHTSTAQPFAGTLSFKNLQISPTSQPPSPPEAPQDTEEQAED